MTACPNNVWNHTDGCACVANGSVLAEASDVHAPVLHSAPDPTTPLFDAVPEGGHLLISPDDYHGFYHFDSATVSRNDDGTFTVEASSNIDLHNEVLRHLADRAGVDLEGDDIPDAEYDRFEAEASLWLNDHEDDVDAWIADRTGGELRAAEWDFYDQAWTFNLEPHASVQHVLDDSEHLVGSNAPKMASVDFISKMIDEAPGFRQRS